MDTTCIRVTPAGAKHDPKCPTPTLETLLTAATRRAADRRTATGRLLASLRAIAAPIARAASAAGISVHVPIGLALSGPDEREYYFRDPAQYVLEAHVGGDVYVVRLQRDPETGLPGTPSSHGWWVGGVCEDGSVSAIPSSGWSDCPRHVAVLVPGKIRELAAALAAKAERMAAETEAAVDLSEQIAGGVK